MLKKDKSIINKKITKNLNKNLNKSLTKKLTKKTDNIMNNKTINNITNNNVINKKTIKKKFRKKKSKNPFKMMINKIDFTRNKKQPNDKKISQYHHYLRNNDNKVFFYLVYALIAPILFFFYRIKKKNIDKIPDKKAIITANHLSFSDPFFIALLKKKKIYFVAKAELFNNPILGAIFVRLGAIPIRRGQSDKEALETAEILLNKEKLIGIFPEGTRVEDGVESKPKSGAARLAKATNSPIVPCAIKGTDNSSKILSSPEITVNVNDKIEPNEDVDLLTQQTWDSINQAKKEI